MITSVHNERVKFIRSLREPKARRQTGCTVLEGVRLVQEALGSGADLVLAAFDERAAASERGRGLIGALARAGVELVEVSSTVLDAASTLESPQGIIAVARVSRPDLVAEMRRLAADGGREARRPLVALLDGVQDPGNVGSIIRSADAFGAAAVFLVNGSADPFNPKVLRASMGSVFHVGCAVADGADVVVEALMHAGFALYYGDAKSATPVYSVDLAGRTAIAVGSEGAGVSEIVRNRGTAVSVPIEYGVDSLNAAMAMTAMLYEAKRQRTLAL